MKLVCNSVRFLLVSTLLSLLNPLVLQGAAAQDQDPTPLIGSQCYNETLILNRQNESVYGIYIGLFADITQSDSCSLGSPINCFINGTLLSAEVLPLCSKLGGISYQQNFTMNCTASSTAQEGLRDLTLLITASNFSSCAAPTCNLTAYKKYNLDPSYTNSFASIAEASLQSYFSDCQFVAVDSVQAQSPSTQPTSAAHRVIGASAIWTTSWVGIMLLVLLIKNLA